MGEIRTSSQQLSGLPNPSKSLLCANSTAFSGCYSVPGHCDAKKHFYDNAVLPGMCLAGSVNPW
jgi:hypothetical protein